MLTQEEAVKEFQPPYQMASSSPVDDIPAPPYNRGKAEVAPVGETEWHQAFNEEFEKQENQCPADEVKTAMRALLMLLPGSVLLLFGALLLLFSEDGQLNLSWSEKYWWLYFAASAPLIYFGRRSLLLLPEAKESES